MKHVTSANAVTPCRTILGLDVCGFSFAEALSFADEMASLPIGQTVISFLNANNANLAHDDLVYRDVLSRHVVFPDGLGVDLASTFVYGEKFPANLNGTDFVPALLTYMEKPRRIGLVGARADVVETAAKNFKQHAPWHEIIVVSDGYFDRANSTAVVERIAALKLDVLLVALGSPQQEKWIDENIKPDHARLVLSVGALFDFTAHAVPRAPKLMRRLRLEWLFRLVVEPRRLWRRYVLGNPLFLLRALRQAFVVRVLGRTDLPGSA